VSALAAPEPLESLGEIFLANLPEGMAAPEDRSGLERLLERAFETARAPWPDLLLEPGPFMRHLAERLPAAGGGQPLERAIASMHLCDLYLACACGLGVPGAVEALERRYLVRLPAVLGRPGRSREEIDSVGQKLREKLIVHVHLSTYTGEGRLGSWIEIIAKRMANREARLVRGRSSGLSSAAAGLADSGNLEQDLLKKDLLAQLQSALSAAGATLSGEQRELLRYHYRDGLSEAKLALLFRTSQPTVSRRLKRAREAIFEETKRRLLERSDLAEAEFASLIADVQSRWLDLTLSQLFGDQTGEEGGAD